MDIEAHPPDRPFVVVVVEGRRGPTGTRANGTIELALAGAQADGWTVLHGWAAPMRRERIVCTGWIRSPDQARRALLAAVSGARLVVGLSTDRETVDRFLDDLRRLGPVERVDMRTEPIGDPGARPTDARQRALLGMLSEGLTIREAADALGMSPRVAARRLR